MPTLHKIEPKTYQEVVALQEELRHRVGPAPTVRLVGGSTGTGPGGWVMYSLCQKSFPVMVFKSP